MALNANQVGVQVLAAKADSAEVRFTISDAFIVEEGKGGRYQIVRNISALVSARRVRQTRFGLKPRRFWQTRPVTTRLSLAPRMRWIWLPSRHGAWTPMSGKAKSLRPASRSKSSNSSPSRIWDPAQFAFLRRVLLFGTFPARNLLWSRKRLVCRTILFGKLLCLSNYYVSRIVMFV